MVVLEGSLRKAFLKRSWDFSHSPIWHRDMATSKSCSAKVSARGTEGARAKNKKRNAVPATDISFIGGCFFLYSNLPYVFTRETAPCQEPLIFLSFGGKFTSWVTLTLYWG